MNKKELKKLLQDDKIAGRIIKDVSHLEWMLDIVLSGYFAKQKLYIEFREKILQYFGLKFKIRLLGRISPQGNIEYRDKVVKLLDKFRVLRNELAHNKYLSDRELHKIYSDNKIRKILENYPDSYYDELEKAENFLDQLTHIRMIRPQRIRLRKTA